MPDVLNPEQRLRSMSHNRGRTRPERILASSLWASGVRYLTHDGYKSRYRAGLPGSPDLVFPKKHIVVFVDGCFWHGCPECKGIPSQSGEYWQKKIEENLERDRRVDARLQASEWTVVRIWEHSLKPWARLADTSRQLVAVLGER